MKPQNQPNEKPESFEESNPYAAPEADLSSKPPIPFTIDARMQEIRTYYHSHESSIRSVIALHYLICSILMLALLISINDLLRSNFNALTASVLLGVGFAFVLMSASIAGLRLFQPWARWLTCLLWAFPIVGSLDLLVFAYSYYGNDKTPFLVLATLCCTISSYILYLFFSKKGAYIFSREYRNVILATPHIVCGPSLVRPFVVILAMIVVPMGFLMFVLGR